ncbi:MAG TPA: NAD(P)/FAD-dependent oxidoreductase [Nitrospiraceae bacterium]|nr:NAD(P)/FAD-dependent oxidoreductase [Nitrospiraceae bacterium]
MIENRSLRGQSIIVVGAGLAGLSAAVDLHDRGATVRVLEARDRIGGRVWTLRDGFAAGQHAEAGADLIEEEQKEVRSLAARLGLELTPILRGGFSFVGRGPRGRPVIQKGRGAGAWDMLSAELQPWVRDYRLAGQQWDSVIARTIGARSVADWLEEARADEQTRRLVLGLRGFFLADPANLSLLALVDQLASEVPGRSKMYRVRGGNDRLATGLSSLLGDGVQRRTAAIAVSQTSQAVQVITRTEDGTERRLTAEYVIFAVPASTLRAVHFSPALPPLQHEAIARLKYGPATRTLLQFNHRFWKRRGCPKAFGTALPLGAIWDGNEEQRGRAGILSLLAGGAASTETQMLIAKHGAEGLARSLDWLGARGVPLIASRHLSWEHDPWAGGGYAYFDPMYDPALRPWLSRPYGRVLFAGEHTSMQWQGYMNGAVESGLRAAAEVRALRAGWK